MWSVVLEDENNKAISPHINFESPYLHEGKGGDLKVLKYLNPWGDTVFNELQVPDLLHDLGVLKELEPDNSEPIKAIVALTKRCVDEGRYLCFYGD